MANYTITLTDTEKKSMEYVAADVDDWITNASTNRARLAKEEIISLNTAHCNKNGVAIAVGEDAQITQAYTLGVVKTAADRNKETSEAKSS
tara:strand:+ start:1038 stop:1310 length:273 start_codon:yes stop_codon:yes gene_type:complete